MDVAHEADFRFGKRRVGANWFSAAVMQKTASNWGGWLPTIATG
jgi:hypothetical protein